MDKKAIVNAPGKGPYLEKEPLKEVEDYPLEVNLELTRMDNDGGRNATDENEMPIEEKDLDKFRRNKMKVVAGVKFDGLELKNEIIKYIDNLKNNNEQRTKEGLIKELNRYIYNFVRNIENYEIYDVATYPHVLEGIINSMPSDFKDKSAYDLLENKIEEQFIPNAIIKLTDSLISKIRNKEHLSMNLLLNLKPILGLDYNNNDYIKNILANFLAEFYNINETLINEKKYSEIKKKFYKDYKNNLYDSKDFDPFYKRYESVIKKLEEINVEVNNLNADYLYNNYRKLNELKNKFSEFEKDFKEKVQKRIGVFFAVSQKIYGLLATIETEIETTKEHLIKGEKTISKMYAFIGIFLKFLNDYIMNKIFIYRKEGYTVFTGMHFEIPKSKINEILEEIKKIDPQLYSELIDKKQMSLEPSIPGYTQLNITLEAALKLLAFLNKTSNISGLDEIIKKLENYMSHISTENEMISSLLKIDKSADGIIAEQRGKIYEAELENYLNGLLDLLSKIKEESIKLMGFDYVAQELENAIDDFYTTTQSQKEGEIEMEEEPISDLSLSPSFASFKYKMDKKARVEVFVEQKDVEHIFDVAEFSTQLKGTLKNIEIADINAVIDKYEKIFIDIRDSLMAEIGNRKITGEKFLELLKEAISKKIQKIEPEEFQLAAGGLRDLYGVLKNLYESMSLFKNIVVKVKYIDKGVSTYIEESKYKDKIKELEKTLKIKTESILKEMGKIDEKFTKMPVMIGVGGGYLLSLYYPYKTPYHDFSKIPEIIAKLIADMYTPKDKKDVMKHQEIIAKAFNNIFSHFGTLVEIFRKIKDFFRAERKEFEKKEGTKHPIITVVRILISGYEYFDNLLKDLKSKKSLFIKAYKYKLYLEKSKQTEYPLSGDAIRREKVEGRESSSFLTEDEMKKDKEAYDELSKTLDIDFWFDIIMQDYSMGIKYENVYNLDINFYEELIASIEEILNKIRNLLYVILNDIRSGEFNFIGIKNQIDKLKADIGKIGGIKDKTIVDILKGEDDDIIVEFLDEDIDWKEIYNIVYGMIRDFENKYEKRANSMQNIRIQIKSEYTDEDIDRLLDNLNNIENELRKINYLLETDNIWKTAAKLECIDEFKKFDLSDNTLELEDNKLKIRKKVMNKIKSKLKTGDLVVVNAYGIHEYGVVANYDGAKYYVDIDGEVLDFDETQIKKIQEDK